MQLVLVFGLCSWFCLMLLLFHSLQIQGNKFGRELLLLLNHCLDYFVCMHTSAAKPQPTVSESRSPSGSNNKSDPPTGSPEKTPPRGETKPEPAPRVRATSSSSPPGGPLSPKPPVPQGAKPALAARPSIPQKPRTTSSSRSIGTVRASDLTLGELFLFS